MLLAFSLVAASCFFAAGGGLGGGALLVPIYLAVLGLEARTAVALSNVTIAAGALASFLINVQRRHPSRPGPLIDWWLVYMLEPLTIVGAMVGSYVNKVQPGWLTTLALAFLLLLMMAVLMHKGRLQYRWETQQMQQQQQQAVVELGSVAVAPDRLEATRHDADADSDDDVAEDVPLLLHANHGAISRPLQQRAQERARQGAHLQLSATSQQSVQLQSAMPTHVSGGDLQANDRSPVGQMLQHQQQGLAGVAPSESAFAQVGYAQQPGGTCQQSGVATVSAGETAAVPAETVAVASAVASAAVAAIPEKQRSGSVATCSGSDCLACAHAAAQQLLTTSPDSVAGAVQIRVPSLEEELQLLIGWPGALSGHPGPPVVPCSCSPDPVLSQEAEQHLSGKAGAAVGPGQASPSQGHIVQFAQGNSGSKRMLADTAMGLQPLNTSKHSACAADWGPVGIGVHTGADSQWQIGAVSGGPADQNLNVDREGSTHSPSVQSMRSCEPACGERAYLGACASGTAAAGRVQYQWALSGALQEGPVEPQFPLGRATALLLLFAVVLATDIAKKSVTCGSAVYWLITCSILPVTVATWLGGRRVLLRRTACRPVGTTAGDIQWTPRNTIVFPVASTAAGLIAGLFGVGGGMVKGPLMLHLGVLPDVAAATSSTMILLTASTSTVVYASFGTIPQQLGWVAALTGFLASLAGQVALNLVVKRMNRRSLIVFTMVLFMAAAVVVVSLQGALLLMAAIQEGALWSAGTICGTIPGH